jgi:methylglutaconyl-CoA hydratase
MAGVERQVLTLALPQRLDHDSVSAMRAQLADVGDAAAIVLEGTGSGVFCRGMDFTHAARMEAHAIQHGLEEFALLLEALLTAPRPTLAVVDGAALGGGLGLASACDFVLASTRATFGLPEALYGLAPAVIRPALLTRISPQELNRLLFTCVACDSGEARALGLVDRVVPDGECETARRAILRQFRRAKSATVIAARRWNASAFAKALRDGVAETSTALCDPAVVAALRAAEEEAAWIP